MPPLPFDTEPPPTTLPFGGESPSTLPFGEPMGDADPPPAPPFAVRSTGRMPTTQADLPSRSQPARRRIRAADHSELPAAMPIAMTDWTP
jgi:hypothetical protein